MGWIRYKRYWVPLVAIVLIACAFSLWLAHAFQGAREDALDSQSQANAYSLATALVWYRDCYGCFPPPFVTDQFGKPLYSWRVLALASFDGEPIRDDFDYTKPWDDPVNKRLGTGDNVWRLKNLFACPSASHVEPCRTDYFYVLDADDRWPRDFFCERGSPAKMLLVESQWREVYWSEPVDFVYDKSAQGFLERLRKTKAPHRGGFNCITSDLSPLKIPQEGHAARDAELSKLFALPQKGQNVVDKERLDFLLGKLTNALNDRRVHLQRPALLLLGELGPAAIGAVPAIRKIIAAGDKGLEGIATLAIAKIEKKRGDVAVGGQ